MSGNYVTKLSAIIDYFKDEEKLISRGENAVESGHVVNMILDPDIRILKGSVHASMRDRTYKVEIKFSSEWTIENADCTCPRGQFMCHHMAALAIFGRYNVSVTDKACTWSSKKDPSTSDVNSMIQLYPPRVHRSTERDLTAQEVERFKDKIKIFDGAVGFTWLLSSEPEEITESLVVGIEDIIFDEIYFKSNDKMKYLCDKLQMSHEKILEVSERTVGQAQNEKWLVYRKHRLTASNFGIVLGACKRNRFPKSLFKRLAGAYNLDHIKSVQWGREHESEGITAIEQALGVKVIRTGLWLHSCGFLGASPDGLIGEDSVH